MSYSHYTDEKEKERSLNIFDTKIHRPHTKMTPNTSKPFGRCTIVPRDEAGRENRNQTKE